MSGVFDTGDLRAHFAALSDANRAFAAAYPGDPTGRQPVHTVYGGAHLFAHDVAAKLGDGARRHLAEWAPDWITFARAVGLPGAERLPGLASERAAFERQLDAAGERARRSQSEAWIAREVYARTVAKLEREPVEDFRVDFEDGYGLRPDGEEDAHAVACAEAMALGLERGTLPPFVGIRIKPFTEEHLARGVRTLELVVHTLLGRTGGRLPGHFVVTLPKVTVPEQLATLDALLARLETVHGLPPRSLPCEFMVETPQSVIGPDGRVPLRAFVAAANGRCRGAHLGVYDYTASLQVTALYQAPEHAACAHARHAMQVAVAGSGVSLSDGAVTVMPVPPHRAPDGASLPPAEAEANRRAVHAAMRAHYDDVRRGLRDAWYQGWDLHPGQLPTRHAAVIAFFLEGHERAAERLRRFVERAAQATLLGQVFDDAATGQGLVNYFLRGLSAGAITPDEARATGLEPDELATRSFLRILERRRS